MAAVNFRLFHNLLSPRVFCHAWALKPYPCLRVGLHDLGRQDGKTLENEIEVVEGMKFDRGYISPYFVTDAKTQMCEMENPLILIVEKKVRPAGRQAAAESVKTPRPRST